ncbi:hypothetical protein ACIQTU_03140 [Brevundimonas sp. NPDC090276]|uniref:hypothetical protein n=1 Tax=Brevundimonas sp. NPDC090276 TaxID=3363956 RepID=UPI00383B1C6A
MRNFKRNGVALGGLMALALSSSALAQNAWIKCDGYGAANPSGDGMTEYALRMGLFVHPGYGTTVRSPAAHGREGVTACDEALQELPDTHWRRKVNLLQARALHRLESRQADDAIADLDQAHVAAAPGLNDPLFQRSQQLGLTLVRALALQHQGSNEEARTLLNRAAEQRPYDSGAISAVHSVASFAGYDDVTQSTLRQTARFLPQVRIRLAWQDFDQGRFEDFLNLHPHLSPALRAADNSLLPIETALRNLANHEASAQFKVHSAIYRAYALTATGRHDEAEAAMDEARAVLPAHRQPPSPPRLRGPALEQYNEELPLTLARIEKQDAAIADMADAIARRRQAGEGKISRLADLFDANAIRRDGTGADTLIATAEFLPPAEAEQARKMAADLRVELAREALKTTSFNAEAFLGSLPSPETPNRLSPWKEAKRPFLAATGSYEDTSSVGYRDWKTDSGLVTVRYRSSKTGTRAIAEELALLRAADLARQSGHKGFFIAARRDTTLTYNTYHLGQILRSDPDGYESELDIRFVDADHQGAPALLVFDAEQVYATLAPIYIRTE